MDRLGAPDQGAIQREKGPSRWVGPEINPTDCTTTEKKFETNISD